MSDESTNNPDSGVEQSPLLLSTSTVPPTKADVQKMFTTSKEMAGREIELVWSDLGKDRTYRLVTRFPVIKSRDHWDYEQRDDPTWTLSDDRDRGNPIIWHYKTSDLELVFEITRMIEKKVGRTPEMIMADPTTASGTDYLAMEEAVSAITDYQVENLYSPETGLYGYSGFLLLLEREYEWFKAYGSPLSLLVFDIRIPADHLGEKPRGLSPDLARLLNRRVVRRLIDTFGHFESLDYGLILPNTDTRQASLIAQRVLGILSKLPLVKEQPRSRLIVTCGIANLPANGNHISDLILGAKEAKKTAMEKQQPIIAARTDQKMPRSQHADSTKASRRAALNAAANTSLRDLLIRSGLVNEQYMDKVLALTKRMPLGRVLELEGHCKESAVNAAEQLDAMIHAGHVTVDDALRTLQLVGTHEIDFDVALKRIGIIKDGLQPNQFAKLLEESRLVNPKQLEKARRQAEYCGLPVGAVLVNMGFLSETMLKAALTAQRLLRADKMTHEDALSVLDEMRVTVVSLPEVFAKYNVAMPDEGLGEALIQKHLITETELMVATELTVSNGHGLVQVLVESGFVSQAAIDEIRKQA